MNIKTLGIIVCVGLASAGMAQAADNPFFGSWKVTSSIQAPWYDGNGALPSVDPELDGKTIFFARKSAGGSKIVECAKPAHDKKAKLSFCSVWLSMNLLVLDPKTVCVEAEEKEQMEQLDKLGFEVVPVPLWDVAAFGGGLHCATADVYREGKLEDYFPKQVPGF